MFSAIRPSGITSALIYCIGALVCSAEVVASCFALVI